MPMRRMFFLVNAVIAWASFALDAVITIGDLYPSVGRVSGEIDYHQAEGFMGTIGRTIDFLSFFTTWSLLAVAIVMTVLARDSDADSPLLRVGRLTALLMTTVTMIVQQMLLSDGSYVGIPGFNDMLEHIIVPIVTVVVWLFFGPRGWIHWRIIPMAVIVPIIWIVYTFLRGAVISAYPYDFLNVLVHGYPSALLMTLGIVVFGLVIAVVYYGIDDVIMRVTRRGDVRSAA